MHAEVCASNALQNKMVLMADIGLLSSGKFSKSVKLATVGENNI